VIISPYPRAAFGGSSGLVGLVGHKCQKVHTFDLGSCSFVIAIGCSGEVLTHTDERSALPYYVLMANNW
jgi:hypothetical protein